jgi:hypothetical protein
VCVCVCVCVEENEDSGPSRTEYLLTAVFGLHCGTVADCDTVQLRSWTASLCPIEGSIQRIVHLMGCDAAQSGSSYSTSVSV